MTKRLERDTQNAVMGGVAAGYADYFGLDPVLVRLGFILLVFLHGAGLILYLISWVVMPVRRPADPPPAAEPAPAPGAEPAPDATGEPAPAPADRFVAEVREAGERTVETIRSGGRGPGQARIFAGFFLIIIGSVFLLDRLFWFHWPWWLRFSTLWPLILVFMGLAMLLGYSRDRS